MADSNINVRISADSTEAQSAINKVANKLSTDIPKGVSEAGSKVAKEAASIRDEIKSIMTQVNKGLQFAGAVTGISLAATAVKDVATAAAQTADQLTSVRCIN